MTVSMVKHQTLTAPHLCPPPRDIEAYGPRLPRHAQGSTVMTMRSMGFLSQPYAPHAAIQANTLPGGFTLASITNGMESMIRAT